MTEDALNKKTKCRDRILEAALDVFASEGIKGATTREIVRVAGVNESTLFRNFQNKEELLKAVVENRVAEMTDVLSKIEIKPKSLRDDLMHYALELNKLTERDEALLRMFIGEADRQPEHATRMIQSARQPLIDKLTAYFKDKQDKGLVRKDLNIRVALDTFSGIVLSAMLTRPCRESVYSSGDYFETAIDIFVRGISTPPSE